jgi:CheY-like chemotaxis protein
VASVLIVEDDPINAETLTSVLEDEGHLVRVARDGQEGLEKIDEAMPDLVLLDVEMPVMNGPEMAYQMFVIDCGREEIPIVLLSGVAALSEIAARVGTPYFHAKPYRIGAVLALIARALDERRAPVPRLRAQP